MRGTFMLSDELSRNLYKIETFEGILMDKRNNNKLPLIGLNEEEIYVTRKRCHRLIDEIKKELEFDEKHYIVYKEI